MLRVLVAEDDRNISDIICLTLTGAGYACDTAFDGEAAADLIEERNYDLALLDIMLPVYSGYDIARYLYSEEIPVIFVTARGSLKDKIKGLNMGADDYIVKPFEPEELVARVDALMRRMGKGKTVYALHGVSLDVNSRRVARGNEEISLTNHEFDLLFALLQSPGTALYRDALYERVWGNEYNMDTRTLDLHIMRLRQKLGWQDKIKTVFKIGYMLEK